MNNLKLVITQSKFVKTNCTETATRRTTTCHTYSNSHQQRIEFATRTLELWCTMCHSNICLLWFPLFCFCWVKVNSNEMFPTMYVNLKCCFATMNLEKPTPPTIIHRRLQCTDMADCNAQPKLTVLMFK